MAGGFFAQRGGREGKAQVGAPVWLARSGAGRGKTAARGLAAKRSFLLFLA